MLYYNDELSYEEKKTKIKNLKIIFSFSLFYMNIPWVSLLYPFSSLSLKSDFSM